MSHPWCQESSCLLFCRQPPSADQQMLKAPQQPNPSQRPHKAGLGPASWMQVRLACVCVMPCVLCGQLCPLPDPLSLLIALMSDPTPNSRQKEYRVAWPLAQEFASAVPMPPTECAVCGVMKAGELHKATCDVLSAFLVTLSSHGEGHAAPLLPQMISMAMQVTGVLSCAHYVQSKCRLCCTLKHWRAVQKRGRNTAGW